ncbi:hypothetical protein RB195_013485 [Necator americanus]|uniref:Uncharacterized protein n=1 Tax=Necator americanus TaxID=51031 RepID=A0ABR1DVT1_NECAM
MVRLLKTMDFLEIYLGLVSTRDLNICTASRFFKVLYFTVSFVNYFTSLYFNSDLLKKSCYSNSFLYLKL